MANSLSYCVFLEFIEVLSVIIIITTNSIRLALSFGTV